MEHIIIKGHSKPETTERAFNTMRDIFTAQVLGYCKERGISLDDAIIEAGCPNPSLTKQFVLEGKPVPTGKDLERLLSFAGGAQTFAEQVPVTIGSELGYAVAGCGTAINENGSFSHVSGSEVPEGLDRLVKRVLSVTWWFYLEATKRFLAQRDNNPLNDAHLPPAP